MFYKLIKEKKNYFILLSLIKVRLSNNEGDNLLLNFVAIKPTWLKRHSDGTLVSVIHKSALATLLCNGYLVE